MDTGNLDYLKEWFSGYCKLFYSQNPDDQRNICLKEEHTRHVCKNIVLISKDQSLSPEAVILAETVALFHDIGRFPQYAEYKTFRDGISVNHGKLGAEVLTKNNILHNLSKGEQNTILNAVRFHNTYALPDLDENSILFLKLIRDADKLDIWRVFEEYYEKTDDDRASAAGLELPDTPGYSKVIMEFFSKKNIIPMANIKTLNDFRLLQLSWIFDLNFRLSFRLLTERDHIKTIISHLPRTDDIQKISEDLQEFVRKKL